jgi:hypothetical protein
VDQLRGRKSRASYLASLVAVIVAAAAEEQERLAVRESKAAEPCPHPPARRSKGLCMACGTHP